MVSLSDQPKDAPVLEAGYGQGVFLQALVDAGHTDLTGYDLDPENHRFVSKKFGDKVDARCGNYLDSPADERYELIIGNPPYVQWNNVAPEVREYLRTDPFWKQYVNGEWDLLYAFIIWSVEKLEDQGELILVVPYNWFNSTYAASLRKYLADHGHFELLAHFSEYKLFSDCAPNALIFKYRRGAKKSPYVKVAEFEPRTGKTEELLQTLRRETDKLDPTRLSAHSADGWRFFTSRQMPAKGLWYLATPKEERTVSKLEKATKGKTIADAFEVSVGIVSGYDKAYLLDAEQLKSVPSNERKLMHSFAKARSCRPFDFGATSPMIFPEAVSDEAELKKRYPWIHKHLLGHSEKLDARYGSRSDRWWEWATVRNLDVFKNNASKPKIFVPCIDRSPVSRFCLTTDEVYAAGDVLCLSNAGADEQTLYYLLGWLNSSWVQDWYRVKGSRTGHRTRYTQAYVSQIPYREIDVAADAEIKLRDQIARLAKELTVQASGTELDQGKLNEIDILIGQLLQ